MRHSVEWDYMFIYSPFLSFKVFLHTSWTPNRHICFLRLQFLVFKVCGATHADLTFKAKRTHAYVCRVNNEYSSWVFSVWVKVKVLEVDKSGTRPPFWFLSNVELMFQKGFILRIFFFFISKLQVCPSIGRVSPTSLSTLNPRESEKARNSLSAALPSAIPLQAISGTEMDTCCVHRPATHCR